MTGSVARTTVGDVKAALQLPGGALVNQRVPKKLLAERGAPTATDRKLIQEHVDTIQWIAALKPTNCGIASLVDASREYLEASVLSLDLRGADCESPKALRLAELTHRAVPYPILLIVDDGANIALSLSHLRRAQDGTNDTVLDGEHFWGLFPVTATSIPDSAVAARQQALDSLRVGRQAWATMWHLYQGWIEVLIAWHTVPLTGTFVLPSSAEDAATTHRSVHRISELNQKIATLRRLAIKEKQVARLADINLAIKRLQYEIDGERLTLRGPPP